MAQSRKKKRKRKLSRLSRKLRKQRTYNKRLNQAGVLRSPAPPSPIPPPYISPLIDIPTPPPRSLSLPTPPPPDPLEARPERRQKRWPIPKQSKRVSFVDNLKK